MYLRENITDIAFRAFYHRFMVFRGQLQVELCSIYIVMPHVSRENGNGVKTINACIALILQSVDGESMP